MNQINNGDVGYVVEHAMWNRLVVRDEKILFGLVLLLKWESRIDLKSLHLDKLARKSML